MIKITDPKECCGCTACASICAHDAITMKPDALGFLYPEVDEHKCVDCGLCENVCAFNDNYDQSLNFDQPDTYAARHKNINEVETSRSGAAFIAISDWILSHGGVVYGAGFEEHFRVVHKRATTKKERDEFKGSKYVQSDLTGVFRQVKQDLRNGHVVLFSGTPCQTAGLNSYIGKKLRANLYLVDIVCHGVPGPFIWRDYIDYLEKKQGDSIVWVNFRDKQKYGWAAHKESYKFKHGGGKMSFTTLFYKHIMFRKSCGNCHYTNLRRPSDLTLADFWHSKNIDPSLNADNKGMSLLLVNTEKGRKLLDEISHEFETLQPIDVRKVMQQALREPFPPHPLRDEFEKCYTEKGFEYTYRKFTKEPFKKRLRNMLSGICKNIKKFIIRK